jgi:hypothetical protein
MPVLILQKIALYTDPASMKISGSFSYSFPTITKGEFNYLSLTEGNYNLKVE